MSNKTENPPIFQQNQVRKHPSGLWNTSRWEEIIDSHKTCMVSASVQEQAVGQLTSLRTRRELERFSPVFLLTAFQTIFGLRLHWSASSTTQPRQLSCSAGFLTFSWWVWESIFPFYVYGFIRFNTWQGGSTNPCWFSIQTKNLQKLFNVVKWLSFLLYTIWVFNADCTCHFLGLF